MIFAHHSGVHASDHIEIFVRDIPYLRLTLQEDFECVACFS